MSIEQQIKESVQTLEIIGGSLYDKQSARGFLEDNALKIGRMLIDAQSIISKQAEEIANLEQKLDTAKYKDCGHTKDPGMYCRTCHVKELQKLSSQQAEEIERLISLLERMDDCGTTGEDARDMHMYVNEALRGSADKWNTSC